MRTICVANMKGGTGKTTTTRTLGEILAESDDKRAGQSRQVLMVDCDPQASLTEMCGKRDVEESLADVLGTTQPGRSTINDVLIYLSPTLALVPSSVELAAVEMHLQSRLGRENALRKALATVREAFNVCLIDAPPSLGLLSVNALTAADGVLIPVQPSATDARALRIFVDTIENVRAELNPGLQVIGIVPVMVDSRLTHHAEVIEAIRGAGLPILPSIGRSVRVSEASAAGEAITQHDADNPRAVEYRQLAQEIEKWLRENQM